MVVDDHRLAYLAEAPVNWCPALGTVLANEEVTADGRSERGNYPVFRRPLRQWMLRITAYADRLIDDLDAVDWPEPIKADAAQLDRPVRGRPGHLPDAKGGPGIEVFTTRPDTLFGATYMVLAPEHPLVDELTADVWPGDVPASWYGRRRDPGATPSPPTGGRRAGGPTSSARSSRARRPACSPAPTRSTPPPAAESPCSSPTTC